MGKEYITDTFLISIYVSTSPKATKMKVIERKVNKCPFFMCDKSTKIFPTYYIESFP